MYKKAVFVIIIMLLIVVAWVFFVDGEFFTESESLPDSTRDVRRDNSDEADIIVDREGQKSTEVSLNYQNEMDFSPEIAKIIFGVQTEDRNMERAFQDNNEKMQQIREQLEELELISLETTSFRVNPLVRRENDEQIDYYRVINQIEVKTNNLKEIGEIIDLAVRAGANRVNSLDYLLADEEKARDEVLSAALSGLEDKIKVITGNLEAENYRLKKLEVNEGRPVVPDMMRMETRGAAADNVVPPIEPGEIGISVSLTATYELY